MVGYTGKAKKYTTNVREAGSAANMIKIWTCTASKKKRKIWKWKQRGRF